MPVMRGFLHDGVLVPFQLRKYFLMFRKPLLNALFDAVSGSFNALLRSKAPLAYRKEKRRLGFISFLHTFGRDMKWHPHIHVLMAERCLSGGREEEVELDILFGMLESGIQGLAGAHLPKMRP